MPNGLSKIPHSARNNFACDMRIVINVVGEGLDVIAGAKHFARIVLEKANSNTRVVTHEGAHKVGKAFAKSCVRKMSVRAIRISLASYAMAEFMENNIFNFRRVVAIASCAEEIERVAVSIIKS